MDQLDLLNKKVILTLQTFFFIDIIFCIAVLMLLGIALNQSYQGEIYSNNYVERLSLVSSVIGFGLGVFLLLKISYFSSSPQFAALILKNCVKSGLAHFICALALIFYFASSYGYLMIILGHIYRNYGYLQLVNAFFYFCVIVYFIKNILYKMTQAINQ